MDPREYHVLFPIFAAVLALLVASPALTRLLDVPTTESFTELWILDHNHRAEDYPFNMVCNRSYSVFLGIGNYLGHCAYYLIQLKFRNQTQQAADSFNQTASSLEPLYNITAFAENERVWELLLTFSIDYAERRHNETFSRVEFYSLTLNDVQVDLRARNYTVRWDSENNSFLGNMFFELWIFSSISKSHVYHNRSVGLWLNMTGS